MQKYIKIRLVVVLLALIALSACSKTSDKTTDKAFPSPPVYTQSREVKNYYLKEEDIIKVSIVSITTATSKEVDKILDQVEDIRELMDILNHARPFSGNATADLYGRFTFSMKDGSETTLEFNQGGRVFIDREGSAAYALEPDNKTQLNAIVDRMYPR